MPTLASQANPQHPLFQPTQFLPIAHFRLVHFLSLFIFPIVQLLTKKNELFFERRHDSLRQLFDGAPIIYQLPPQISQIIDIKKKKKKTIASYHTNTDSNGQV